ncbi:hypothetical protein D3C85_1690470 [compost metagenome]
MRPMGNAMLSNQDRAFRAIMQESARHIRFHWWQSFERIGQSRRAMVRRMHNKALHNSRTLGVK